VTTSEPIDADKSSSGEEDSKSSQTSSRPENDEKSAEAHMDRETDPQLITGDIEPFSTGKLTDIKMGKSAPQEAMDLLTNPTPGSDPKAAAEPANESKVDDGARDKPDSSAPEGAKKGKSEEVAQGKSDESVSAARATDGGTTTHHHHYHMLDTVLDQSPPLPRRFKQTMIFDIVLALGLLLVVGGFTTGLMRIYITHMAKQSIYQHNYKAAITILKRNPIPEFFNGFGSDPNELLNQALYLDAMDKLEADPEDQAALNQLSKISAGSRFFTKAQEILQEKSRPSSIQLEGGASEPHIVTPEEETAAKKPVFQKSEE